MQNIVILKSDNWDTLSTEISKILEPQGFVTDSTGWVKLTGEKGKEIIKISLNPKGNAVSYEAINLTASKKIVKEIKKMKNYVLVNDNGVNIRFKNSSNNFKYQVIYEEDYNRCIIAILNSPDHLTDITQTSAPTSSGVDEHKIFPKVEVEAEFPGGIKEWRKYIAANLDANVPVDSKAPLGTYTVIVRFVIFKNGNVFDVVAETKHGYGMEQEAIRVIKNSPKWNPGIQDGRNVNSVRRQPITFIVRGK